MTLVRRTKSAEATIAAQIRAARAMLSWSQTELARRSRIALRTLVDLETGRRDPRDGTVERLVAVLSEAGVEMSRRGGRAFVSIKTSRTTSSTVEPDDRT